MQITGTIKGTESGKIEPLISTNVYVSDEEGKPIFINGSSIGTITNEKGEFTLSVPPQTQYIAASYVGFGTKVKEIDTSGVVNLLLASNSFELQEVTIKPKEREVTKDNTKYWLIGLIGFILLLAGGLYIRRNNKLQIL